MAILEERNSRELSTKDNKGNNAAASSVNGHMRLPLKSHALRATKHGSFDFERPGWGASNIARSASGASASTGASADPSKERSKDSLSGSSKDSRGKVAGSNERKTRPAKPSDRLNRRPLSSQGPSAKQKGPENTISGASTANVNHARSFSAGNQTTTTTTGNAGLSNSLGRSSGAKFGGGIARLVGMTHGPFAFEKPVPSPNSATSSASKSSGIKGRDSAGKKAHFDDVHVPTKQDRKREGRKTLDFEPPSPDISEPSRPRSFGYRSGSKGRSLDLNIGLAWAPQKIKEEAVLPSANLHFVKSTGRNGRAASPPSAEKMDRSKAGKEIAQIFRSALNDDAYATFKKYVHRFDAHEIPFDGPNGILAKTERLLNNSSNLSDDSKRRLLDNLIRIILQNA
jgi:hypothetical protein